MNDEQQLWKDVQKFLNQYPGLIALAKKIGEIGDLKTWQENEQRKLEALTQEVEKQRAIIASEREAANADTKRKQEEIENQIRAHDAWAVQAKSNVESEAKAVLGRATQNADEVVSEAQAKAREIIDVTEPKKAGLEAEITALMDKMLEAKNEHERVTDALAKTKDEHARFVSRIVGTAG